MRGKRHDPGKHHAKERSAQNVFKGFRGSPTLENQRDDNSIRRNQQRKGGSSLCAESAEGARSPSSAGEREQHAGGDIERGIGSRKGRSEYYKIHEVRGAWNVDGTKDGNEGALGHSSAVPRHDSDEDDDGAEIKKTESQKCHADGAGDGGGRAGFTRSHGYEFHTPKGI